MNSPKPHEGWEDWDQPASKLEEKKEKRKKRERKGGEIDFFCPFKKKSTERKMTTTHVMYFDGCSKGNPGKAGCGAVIYEVPSTQLNTEDEVWADCQFVGTRATNNVAEYSGLLLGLQGALGLRIRTLHVRGDSLLVINQMKGTWAINKPHLKKLQEQACQLVQQFDCVTFEHVLRQFNTRADELSNDGLIKR
jgi:ribonuclease HI